VRAMRRPLARGFSPAPTTLLEAGDVLVLLGTPDKLVLAEARVG